MKSHHLAMFLAIGALFSAGCSSPTTPSVVPAATTAPAVVAQTGVAVAGKVYDTAHRQLGGATVEVMDGPSAGTTATTLSTGEFALRGAFDENTRFRATRAGHADAIVKLSPRCAACNPNFWIFFYLAVPVPPADIASDYTLTVTADEACTALPGHARRRTYSATIVASPSQPSPGNTNFNATIGGANLVTRLGDGIFFAVAGDYMQLYMGDLHGDPGLLEITAPDEYFSIGGLGTATLGASGASTITAEFEGDFTHCALTPGASPLDATGRYSCVAGRVATHVTCQSRKHQLVLTRR